MSGQPLAADQPGPASGVQARILDRGYRSYDGERTGVRGAVRALIRHSIQRGLGLRRTVWAKLLPLAMVAVAYVPGIVFVGVIALVPVEELAVDFLPSYGEYYGYVIAAIMVFVALIAPEMLCTDRRSGMLGVYLASPLDRTTYLLGKAVAVAFVLSLVCLGPPLFMLVANVLQSQGPDSVVDIGATLFDVVVAGVALTLLYTGVTLGAASLTDRKSVAAAGIIMLFLVTLTITAILTDTGAAQGVRAWSVTSLSLEVAARAHGETTTIMPSVSSAVVWLSWTAWTAGGFLLALVRIRRLEVTR